MGVDFVAGPAGGANTVPGVGSVGVVGKGSGCSEMDVTREGFAVLSWVGITSVVFRWSCIKKVTPTLQVMRLLAVGVMTADGLVEGCKTCRRGSATFPIVNCCTGYRINLMLVRLAQSPFAWPLSRKRSFYWPDFRRRGGSSRGCGGRHGSTRPCPGLRSARCPRPCLHQCQNPRRSRR